MKLYELTDKYAELQQMIEDGADVDLAAMGFEIIEGNRALQFR